MDCSLCIYKYVEERRNGEHTHAFARLAGAWCDMARRWAQAHNVRVNSLSKSGPKPRRLAISFYRLFLL
jgi:hypothetical protein